MIHSNSILKLLTKMNSTLLRPRLFFVFLPLLTFGSGCASIVHSGARNIVIRSNPTGANVLIVKQGTDEAVSSGTTPMTVSLTPKAGFFKGQAYKLQFAFPGYQTTELAVYPSLSGWYFGNIIFGGLIGMVIVDPLTGSMWNLAPEEIDQTLFPLQAEVLEVEGEMDILVTQLSNFPESERPKLVRMN